MTKAAKRSIWTAVFLVMGFASQVAHAEIDCRRGADAKEAARGLFQSITSAYEVLTREHGEDVLKSGRAELMTRRGQQTIGTIWSEFLNQAKYPNFEMRQQCARLLVSAGLDDPGATVLVMMPANYDAYEHLYAQLKKIAGAKQ